MSLWPDNEQRGSAENASLLEQGASSVGNRRRSLSSLLFDSSDGNDESEEFIDNVSANNAQSAARTEVFRGVYVHDRDNLDTFLADVYDFYVHGGLGAFLLAKGTDVAKLAFVAMLMYISLGCVHFGDALEAASAQERNGAHAHISDFWQCGALPWWSYPLASAFCMYAAAMTWNCAQQVHRMFLVRDFYQFELLIDRVHAMRWCEVVERILRVQELQRMGVGSDALAIAVRLTRRANFFTALITSDALAIPVPEQTTLMRLWPGLFNCSSIAQERMDNGKRAAVHPTMTQSLEWALERTVFAVAFDAKDRLAAPLRNKAAHGSIDWIELVGALRTRFRVLAILSVLFSPFVLCMLFVNFLLENGDQWRASRAQSILANRYWSPEARWLFRHYNELPHQCRKRLARAHGDTARFIDNFARPKTAIVARFAAFCVGSIIALLLLFGLLYDDDALTNIDVALGRSAIWWIGVLSAAMAVLRSLVPDENVVFEPQRHLCAAAKNTHYMPRFWRGREHKPSVRKQMARMCEHHWTLWLRELQSVLAMPYLLWSVLPHRSDAILRSIGRVAHTDNNLGDMCRFSAFLLDEEAQRVAVQITSTDGANLSRQEILFRAQQHGKPLLSFAVFCGNYPQFDSGCLQTSLCASDELTQKVYNDLLREAGEKKISEPAAERSAVGAKKTSASNCFARSQKISEQAVDRFVASVLLN